MFSIIYSYFLHVSLTHVFIVFENVFRRLMQKKKYIENAAIDRGIVQNVLFNWDY